MEMYPIFSNKLEKHHSSVIVRPSVSSVTTSSAELIKRRVPNTIHKKKLGGKGKVCVRGNSFLILL